MKTPKTTEKKVSRPRGRPATGIMPKRYFRVSDDDWRVIVEAAEAAGQTTSEWMRIVLLRAAKRVPKQQSSKLRQK